MVVDISRKWGLRNQCYWRRIVTTCWSCLWWSSINQFAFMDVGRTVSRFSVVKLFGCSMFTLSSLQHSFGLIQFFIPQSSQFREKYGLQELFHEEKTIKHWDCLDILQSYIFQCFCEYIQKDLHVKYCILTRTGHELSKPAADLIVWWSIIPV